MGGAYILWIFLSLFLGVHFWKFSGWRGSDDIHTTFCFDFGGRFGFEVWICVMLLVLLFVCTFDAGDVDIIMALRGWTR